MLAARFPRLAKSRSKTFCVRSKTASSFSAANSFSASVSWPLSLSSLLLPGDYPTTPLDMGASKSEAFLDGGYGYHAVPKVLGVRHNIPFQSG